jgi:hypothetical protein
VHCEIHKLINCVWVKEEMLKHGWESVIYKKIDKTDCNNYQGTLLLSSISSNILVSRLTGCAEVTEESSGCIWT